jgi:flagellar biosynthetic protein FliR
VNHLATDIIEALPLYLPVFIRVALALMVMPGLGETTVPAIARIGISGGIALALTPIVIAPDQAPHVRDLELIPTILSEAVTGIWFGWLTRVITQVLPTVGQYIAYMIGLSNVLQQGVDLGAQSSAFGTLFDIVAPLLFLSSGLYMVPLHALVGLFAVIPIGHVLPLADSTETSVAATGMLIRLSMQLASPFIVMSVLWHIFVGQLSRLGGRLQIYFVSFSGQILLGLLLFMLSIGPILVSWDQMASQFLSQMPGMN